MIKPEKLEMLAKTFRGLEDILAEEIEHIGGEEIEKGNRYVKFVGDLKLLYKANVYLRTALRILVPIEKTEINSQDDYYNFFRNINWENYLGLHHTFAIDSVIASDIFKNSLFASQRGKDAIVDYFRQKYHKRPSVHKSNPDILINVHLADKELTISLDSSGDSLHKRGYRREGVPAPINEVLAAAIVKLAVKDFKQPIIDPMCGSGTLAIEAAMMGRGMPPGMIRRSYCFQNWANYQPRLMREVYDEIEITDTRIKIFANDISEEAIEHARSNAMRANVNSFIRFSNKDFDEYKAKVKEGVVLINPPYGERLEIEDVEAFYASIGNRLKNHYVGYNAWIISSNVKGMKKIGLKPDRKIKLFNGSLECTLNQYVLFEGGLKGYKEKQD